MSLLDMISTDMRTPSVASGILHAGIVVLAVVGLPWFERPTPPEPEPMIIDFEEIGPKAAAPTVAPVQPVTRAPVAREITPSPPPTSVEKPPAPKVEPPKPPEPPKVEKPAPPKPPEPIPTKAAEPEKAQPDPEIALKPPTPEPPTPEPPKPAPPKPPEGKKPDPKPDPPKQAEKPKPPPAPPKPPEKTMDQILDDVLKNKQQVQQPHKPVQEAAKPAQPTRTATTAPNFAQRLTSSEMAAMAEKVRPCWNINPDAMNAQSMLVEIVVDMQPDGTVSGARIGEGTRISGPQHQAFAQAALRAVLNPRCQPLPYPQGKYETLKQFVFRFDPRDL